MHVWKQASIWCILISSLSNSDRTTQPPLHPLSHPFPPLWGNLGRGRAFPTVTTESPLGSPATSNHDTQRAFQSCCSTSFVQSGIWGACLSKSSFELYWFLNKWVYNSISINCSCKGSKRCIELLPSHDASMPCVCWSPRNILDFDTRNRAQKALWTYKSTSFAFDAMVYCLLKTRVWFTWLHDYQVQTQEHFVPDWRLQ